MLSTRLLAIGMFAGAHQLEDNAAEAFDALPFEEQTHWLDKADVFADDYEYLTKAPFATLHRTLDETRNEIERRSMLILDQLKNRDYQKVRAALKRAGWGGDYLLRHYDNAELTRRNNQYAVEIHCSIFRCGDTDTGTLCVPLDVFEAGPEAFSGWVDSLLDQDQKVAADEAARKEEAARKAQEERDRQEYERLKAKFGA